MWLEGLRKELFAASHLLLSSPRLAADLAPARDDGPAREVVLQGHHIHGLERPLRGIVYNERSPPVRDLLFFKALC